MREHSWGFSYVWLWVFCIFAGLLVSPCIWWRGRRMAYFLGLCLLGLLVVVFLWIRDFKMQETFNVQSHTNDSQRWQLTDWSLKSCDGQFEISGLWMDAVIPRSERDPISFPEFPNPFGIGWQSHDLTAVWGNDAAPPRMPPDKRSPKGTLLGGIWGFVYWESPLHEGVSGNFGPGTGLFLKSWGIYFPTWAAAVVFALSPALWLSLGPIRRRRFRLKGNLCVRCGYNLTGTPATTDGTRRCSECGTVNPAAKVEPASTAAAAKAHGIATV